MAGDLKTVPRRMRRYYRKEEQPPAETVHAEQEANPRYRQLHQRHLSSEEMQKMQVDVKKQSSEIAAREIRRFKEKFNRLPKTGEFDEIAESVYNQAKKQTVPSTIPAAGRQDEELHGRFRHARGLEQKVSMPVQEERPAEQAVVKQEPVPAKSQGLSIEDLLKGINVGEESEKEKKDSLSIEDLNLESEDLKKSLDLLRDDESSENFLKEVESEKNTCPNCNNKTEHLIFCPNCGTAFCTHCAKQAKIMEDKISYVCPKCSAEFKARKMA